MVEILLVLEAGAYASFILAAAFAVWQLRIMTRNSRTQNVVDLFTRTSEAQFAGSVMRTLEGDFTDAREAEVKCSRDSLIEVGHYFEGLGLLPARGLVDDDLVLEVWPYSQVSAKMKPWTDSLRQRYGPIVFEWFEYLASEERRSMSRRSEEGLDPNSIRDA